MFPELIRFKVEPEVNSFAHIVTQNKDNTQHTINGIFCILTAPSIHTWQWDHLVGFPLGKKMMTTIMAQLTMAHDTDERKDEEKKQRQQQQQQHHTLTLLTVFETTTINRHNGTYIMRKTRHSTLLCFSLSTIFFMAMRNSGMPTQEIGTLLAQQSEHCEWRWNMCFAFPVCVCVCACFYFCSWKDDLLTAIKPYT